MFIYSLINPKDGAVRYIGFTSRTLERRLSGHINDAINGKERYVCNWIRSLLRLNLRPVIQAIEVINGQDKWQDREKYWIAFYREKGCSLTNLTDGGDGCHGYSPPESVREKLRIANKGQKRPEAFCKLSSLLKLGNKIWQGKKHSEATKEKMRLKALGNKNAIGTHPTEETRQKIRESKIGHKYNVGRKASNETREKIRLSRLGKKPWLGKKHSLSTRIKMIKLAAEKKKGTSRYIGVHFDKTKKRWAASIQFNGKTKALGRFLFEVDAAKKRDTVAVQIYGNDVPLNFPQI